MNRDGSGQGSDVQQLAQLIEQVAKSCTEMVDLINGLRADVNKLMTDLEEHKHDQDGVVYRPI